MSAALVVILSFLTYYYMNNPISDNAFNRLSTKINIYYNDWIETYETPENELKNVLLVNISNDKELVVVRERLLPKGEVAITDRAKLAQFLLKLNNNHKYVFCDIIFDGKLRSPNDSLLQLAFNKTERIIIPAPTLNDSTTPPKFDVKTGTSHYITSLESNRFMKYTFSDGNFEKSVPLEMYKDIYDNDIIKRGFGYFSDDKLCLNSIVLNYKIRPIKKYNEVTNNLQILELGADILDGGQDEGQFEQLVKDKIILIGDFEDRDQHRTVYGEMPGVLISYNAFLALRDTDHILPLSLIIILICVYLIFSTAMLFGWDKKLSFNTTKLPSRFIKNRRGQKKYFPLLPKMDVLRLFIDAGKYFVLLSLLSIFIFLVYGIHLELLAMVFIFTLINEIRNWIFEFQKNIKESKQLINEG